MRGAKKAIHKRTWIGRGSATSQGRVKKRWELERQLTACGDQQKYWERRLVTAEEGKKRWTAQLTDGNGRAHTILQGFVREVTEAQGMIASFKERAIEVQKQIDALALSPKDAAQRAKDQEVVAMLLLARGSLDGQIDSLLALTHKTLARRAALSSELRERVSALEFSYNLNLDTERFEALAHTLPKEIAAESKRFTDHFLGLEEDLALFEVPIGTLMLDETLTRHGAYRTGDRPLLNSKEKAEFMRKMEREGDPIREVMPANVNTRSEVPKGEPVGAITWGIIRQ
jgi:hypothetical protein